MEAIQGRDTASHQPGPVRPLHLPVPRPPPAYAAPHRLRTPPSPRQSLRFGAHRSDRRVDLFALSGAWYRRLGSGGGVCPPASDPHLLPLSRFLVLSSAALSAPQLLQTLRRSCSLPSAHPLFLLLPPPPCPCDVSSACAPHFHFLMPQQLRLRRPSHSDHRQHVRRGCCDLAW